MGKLAFHVSVLQCKMGTEILPHGVERPLYTAGVVGAQQRSFLSFFPFGHRVGVESWFLMTFCELCYNI